MQGNTSVDFIIMSAISNFFTAWIINSSQHKDVVNINEAQDKNLSETDKQDIPFFTSSTEISAGSFPESKQDDMNQ